MPDLSGWELSSFLTRCLFYFSLLLTLGATFSLWLLPDSSRRFLRRSLLTVILGAIIGFDAVLIYFLVQIGGVNQSGPGGMLDWDLIRFYLQLPVGDATVMRLSAFLLLLIGELAALVHISNLTRPPRLRFMRLLLAGNLLCLAFILYSLRLTGHIAVQPWQSQLALMVHVGAMSFWLGSLYPLYRMTLEFELPSMQETLRRFSQLAVTIVGMLLAAAGVMAWQLFATPQELLASSYGRSLLIKSALVCLLLGLAALNKWYLVPGLAGVNGPQRLRLAIRGEMLVGTLILFMTGILSTLMGPGEH